ncbi:hypothetical protein QQ045_022008 [Rhodiola kirilowii]
MMPRGASMAFFPNGGNPIVSKMSMGLVKKVEELSTLCGVEACAIIYASHTDLIPETWPADHFEVKKFVNKVKALPEYELTKFSVNADILVEQNIEKAKVKLEKMKRENRVKEAREAMSHLLEGRELSVISADGYNDVLSLIDRALKDVQCHMEELMITKNPNEASVFPEKEKSPSEDLMEFAEDEMSSSQGFDPHFMESDLVYNGMANEQDMIDFDVNFNFDIELEDQWI